VDNDLRSGDTLDGKYRIDALIGQGGMGAVYRATHLHTTRTVAIKVIRPHLTSRPEFVERFRREAEAAGRLRHPNVVDVTDFGFAATADGQVAYLVMEFLDGCTLADVLKEEKRLPVSWTVDIVEQVSSALDEAHRLGMVHRDLKPDNVWLEPNTRGGSTVKVLDFGLVKLEDLADPAHPANQPPQAPVDGAEAETIVVPAVAADAFTIAAQAVTRFGSITGTPMYMSPEQCRGDRVDGRSDIYSLGVITYALLAGEPPFTGDAATLMRRHLGEPPVPLRTRTRRVPRAAAAIVMSALSKEPAARPSRAGGYASALRAATEGSGTLLRQALAMYSERSPVLLRLSALAYTPLVIFLVGLAILDARGGGTSPLMSALIILTMIALNVGTYLLMPALVAPIVYEAVVAPLRPTAFADAWAAVQRRRKALLSATACVVALTAVASLFLILPGLVVAIGYAVYAPVVVMEDITVRDALRRARRLARRAWSTVLIITALQFALPVLVWFAAVDVDFVFRVDENWQPREFRFGLAVSWTSALYQMLGVFVAPLTATMTALLYLKSRQAGGEELHVTDALAGASARRSQRRLRTRIQAPSGPLPEPSTPSPAGR
jgi:serine/threonine protein kinase